MHARDRRLDASHAALAMDGVVPFRLREDLQWIRRESELSRWVLYDPLASEYAILSELEACVAARLDGQSTLRTLSVGVDSDGVPYRAEPEWVLALLQRLRGLGLLVSMDRMRAESSTLRRSEPSWLARSMQLLQLRIPWFDPSRWLDRWVHSFGFVFGRVGIAMWGVALLMTAISLLQNGGRLMLELPYAASSLFSDRWWYLLVVLAGVKIVHEMGHAMACHAYGARCHEMGVMFLLGVPCLYCDVTDAWRIADPKRRAMIAAAGVYVEIVVAMVAYWVWLRAGVPAVRLGALQVFLSSTVVTLLINGNPLMRYDGYYVMSDLFGITNLSERAAEHWQAWKRAWFGTRSGIDAANALQPASGYVAYYIASSMYRWFVLVGLLLAIRSAWIFAGATPPSPPLWVGMGVGAWMGISAMSRTSAQRRADRSGGPWKLRWGLVAACCGGLLVVPWPQFHTARGVLRPRDSVALHARQSAFLVECVPDGTPVRAGEVVLRMESPEWSRQALQLEGEWALLQSRVAQLQRRAVDDPLVPAMLAEAQEQLAGLQSRREEVAEELDKLTWKAPIDGIFLLAREGGTLVPGEERSLGWKRSMDALAQDRKWLERGTSIATIQPEHPEWRMDVIVPEAELSSLHVELAVGVRLDQSPRRQWSGTVERIEMIQQTQQGTKPEESAGGELAERKEWIEANRVLGAEFRVVVAVDSGVSQWHRDGQGTIRWQGHWTSGLDWIGGWLSRDLAFGRVTTNLAPDPRAESTTRTEPRSL